MSVSKVIVGMMKKLLNKEHCKIGSAGYRNMVPGGNSYFIPESNNLKTLAVNSFDGVGVCRGQMDAGLNCSLISETERESDWEPRDHSSTRTL